MHYQITNLSYIIHNYLKYHRYLILMTTGSGSLAKPRAAAYPQEPHCGGTECNRHSLAPRPAFKVEVALRTESVESATQQASA
jgi:hypothetical protein